MALSSNTVASFDHVTQLGTIQKKIRWGGGGGRFCVLSKLWVIFWLNKKLNKMADIKPNSETCDQN